MATKNANSAIKQLIFVNASEFPFKVLESVRYVSRNSMTNLISSDIVCVGIRKCRRRNDTYYKLMEDISSI